MDEIEHHKRILEKKRQAEKQSAEEIVQKLSEYSCTISRKVGRNDKLFGSVSSTDIHEELTKAGFVIEKKMIHLKEHIKALGVHPVTVKLQPDVSATVKVWVVKQE